jgi:5-methyltetrahydrofolate--homocysteine methyltransferase
MGEFLTAVAAAIDDMDLDGIEERVLACLRNGIEPEEIIERGISPGLDIVGQKFEDGEYFLGDLVMAGEVVKTGMKRLEAVMDPARSSRKGKIILATVEGDIHEIGKNVLGMILSAAGWEVIDLGVNVPASTIVDAVNSSGARLIGLSVLLTTMIGAINQVVRGLTDAGLRENVRIAIGGACCSQRLADEMGMDAYGETAVEGTRIFERLSSSLSQSDIGSA